MQKKSRSKFAWFKFENSDRQTNRQMQSDALSPHGLLIKLMELCLFFSFVNRTFDFLPELPYSAYNVSMTDSVHERCVSACHLDEDCHYVQILNSDPDTCYLLGIEISTFSQNRKIHHRPLLRSICIQGWLYFLKNT